MTEYFGIHTEGWLADRGKDDSLILDDGSVWQISPHRDKARGVGASFQYKCERDPGKLGEYCYALMNEAYRQQAEARVSGHC